MSDRKLVKPTATPQSIVPASIVFKGGTIEGRGGLLIDGNLTGTTIVSMDDTTIHVSAQAMLTDCRITANDLLIEGQFDGFCKVKGNCEVGQSARVIGKMEVEGDFFKSRMADAVDLQVQHMRLPGSREDEGNVAKFQAVAAA